MDFIKKNRIVITILVFWIIVSVVVFIQASIAMYLNCQPNDRFTTIIVCCGWLFWSILTPLIVNIINKLEKREAKLSFQIFAYIFLSIAFIAIHIIMQMVLYNLTLTKGKLSIKLPDYIIYHIHTQFVVFFFIVFVVKGISYYKRYGASRVREEKLNTELSNSRLEALKMQLNPHFLFNTHHSIISLMAKNDTKKATDMLIMLSDFLRITLTNTNQLTSLSDELKLMKFYLDIQQIRFGEKLSVNINAEKEVLNAAVPAFITQPLIENAIIHGIAPYSQPASLLISCFKLNEMLEIHIYDNGGGINTEQFEEGVGIKNIKARIKELYNEKGGVIVRPHTSKGTLSKIWIPFTDHNDTNNE